MGANLYFLMVAVYKIHQHSQDSLIVHKSRSASLRNYAKGLFGLLFLLGITWSIGIFSVVHPSPSLIYLFTILNSLQGLFIFVFNCLINKKIRKEGKAKIQSILRCFLVTKRRHLLARKESTLSSSSGTSTTSTSSSVKEYFLPEICGSSEERKRKKENTLSITYYY